LAASGLLAVAFPFVSAEVRRPNIIFILMDDQRWDEMDYPVRQNDLDYDPYEMTNIIGDPKAPALIHELDAEPLRLLNAHN